MLDDTRDFIRKSPAVAIGIAAVAGFALLRRDQDRPRRCRRWHRLEAPGTELTWTRKGRIRARSSIGDLFGRLIDDGKSYAKAEIDVYRQVALHRAGAGERAASSRSWPEQILLLSALTALIIGAVLGLSASHRRPGSQVSPSPPC